jgi:hypothetical protein
LFTDKNPQGKAAGFRPVAGEKVLRNRLLSVFDNVYHRKPFAKIHSINQSINHSINQSINQSIIQSINQSINHSITQSINQSINIHL